MPFDDESSKYWKETKNGYPALVGYMVLVYNSTCLNPKQLYGPKDNPDVVSFNKTPHIYIYINDFHSIVDFKTRPYRAKTDVLFLQGSTSIAVVVVVFMCLAKLPLLVVRL